MRIGNIVVLPALIFGFFDMLWRGKGFTQSLSFTRKAVCCLFWDEYKERRIKRFCSKVNSGCSKSFAYREAHRRRVAYASEMYELLDLHLMVK